MAEAVKDFFDGLKEKVDPSKVAGLNATFQFDITGDGGGQWNVKLADGQVEIAEGTAEDASITMTAAVEDWLKIVSGELGGQAAFLTGKLKIKGDMTLAMKLQSVFQLG